MYQAIRKISIHISRMQFHHFPITTKKSNLNSYCEEAYNNKKRWSHPKATPCKIHFQQFSLVIAIFLLRTVSTCLPLLHKFPSGHTFSAPLANNWTASNKSPNQSTPSKRCSHKFSSSHTQTHYTSNESTEQQLGQHLFYFNWDIIVYCKVTKLNETQLREDRHN